MNLSEIMDSHMPLSLFAENFIATVDMPNLAKPTREIILKV